jgi:membrane protein YdbS with pleckstrin-like domain
MTLTPTEVIRQRGVIHRTETVVPIDRIQDVSVRSVLWKSNITITSAGGRYGFLAMSNLLPTHARAFVDQVRAMQRSIPPSSRSGL